MSIMKAADIERLDNLLISACVIEEIFAHRDTLERLYRIDHEVVPTAYKELFLKMGLLKSCMFMEAGQIFNPHYADREIDKSDARKLLSMLNLLRMRDKGKVLTIKGLLRGIQ